MNTYLSVPPALAGAPDGMPQATFLTRDPPGIALGSGGGTAHLLVEAWRARAPQRPFADWLATDRRILLHAGGRSRRLPAYAPSGKALLPVPVFRWSSGQRLDQTLFDLQRPLLDALLQKAPPEATTLLACGDALVWNEAPLPPVPEADVVCVGLWTAPETATAHGVFFTPRSDPGRLEFARQKPPLTEIRERAAEYLFLIDVGIWLFRPRALEVLLEVCGWDARRASFHGGTASPFDLFGRFDEALGRQPYRPHPAISALSCAVLPLGEAEFHHFGTSADLVRSALALQNRVLDQRRIRSPLVKPHPAIFVQNAQVTCALGPENRDIWIENAEIGAGWTLHSRHVLTGIPGADWTVDLPEGVCLDLVPVGASDVAVRVYGFGDEFRGPADADGTGWLGIPAREAMAARGLPPPDGTDLQETALFPVFPREALDGDFVAWLAKPDGRADMARRYREAPRLSADALSDRANLARLFADRARRLAASLPELARNAGRSVFRQVDLDHAASLCADAGSALPEPAAAAGGPVLDRIHDRMFRAAVLRRRGENGDADEAAAFAALREAIVAPYREQPACPRNTALADQVIWARAPVRLDLAGGWTDTPPYCFLHGGRVVNLAADLNGQPPIQVFARVGAGPGVTLRSIDLGTTERLESYAEIGHYAEPGSGFAIPRAALALAGFHPDFQAGGRYRDLRAQLDDFGGGIELSLLCAVPKGSGLGTSSILASTVLAALSELCGLGWDTTGIGNRTLALEQMLTTGGGWQDQYGGITRGLKLLRTAPGLDQTPELRWLPDHLFTDPLNRGRLLLYYTGITRLAKNLLGEIVRGMFLNRRDVLATVAELGRHAEELYACIQRGDFVETGRGVGRTWALNRQLDAGAGPPEVMTLIGQVDDLAWGVKLLGAGGGGYLLILAKDEEAAVRIRRRLGESPPNARARFVDFSLSPCGLQVTRS